MCICAYGRVCLILLEGGQRRKEIRTFRKETADLLALRTWLLQEGCSHVAMESTGVYWLPVYRRLEGFFELVVGNAQHSKGVKGSKNGCAGCAMDCRPSAVWTHTSQFCAQPATTRCARLEAYAGKSGAGTVSAGE
jgi:hypothetical protein